MPRASANGVEIEYETFGDPDGLPLLLIVGLGSQMIAWDDEFCHSLVDRGFYVIRFDNRDVGLSTKIATEVDVMGQIMAAFGGEPIHAPYLLHDMAGDAVAVLDDLGVEAAHVVGRSLGGMVAQTMAIESSERVLSLTSIMSSTGDPDVGQPHPEVLPMVLQGPAENREEAIERAVETGRVIGSPDNFEADRALDLATRSYDRCFYPTGQAHQLLAALASGSRSDALRTLDLHTLVIHGELDPLIDVSGGERTAEVIAHAELLILEGMGHDMPTSHWSAIIEAITALAVRSS